jgi:hypothetical protein
VLTTGGISILCTALKTQKVGEWLPLFEETYREVKEEQADDYHSKKQFIKALRIKKDDYYVANSEVVGDVFEDNDQVFCEISSKQTKKQNKNQKLKNKSIEEGKADPKEEEGARKPKD